MDIDDDLPKHLILMGQDKRFIVTSLNQSMIRNEIQKVLILWLYNIIIIERYETNYTFCLGSAGSK